MHRRGLKDGRYVVELFPALQMQWLLSGGCNYDIVIPDRVYIVAAGCIRPEPGSNRVSSLPAGIKSVTGSP